MAEDDVDFAVAAYRDEGEWQVVELNPRLGEDVEQLSHALAGSRPTTGCWAWCR